MATKNTKSAAPARTSAAEHQVRLNYASGKLHDAAQAVLNEIDRLALVCAGTDDLRQALRDYKGAQA
jgi:hypothetical protein